MSVHTIGMRFSLDVAERGRFAGWDLVAGSVLALGSELDCESAGRGGPTPVPVIP